MVPSDVALTELAEARRALVELLAAAPAFLTDATGGKSWEELVSSAARPGRGGRQVRVDRVYATQATEELMAELGLPRVVTDKGALLNYWEVDPEGDGALVVRLSGEDLKRGETAFGQAHELRALTKTCGLRPRWLLVGVRLSGRRQYATRLDFQFIEHHVAHGALRWVAYRDASRVARHGLPSESFYARMQELDVSLYFAALGRQVHWADDRLYLQVTSMVNEHERDQAVTRMWTARERLYPLAGRGWPGSQKFGFVRNDQGYLVVDEEQWRFVEIIHRDFGGFAESGKGGLRQLRGHLAALGCPVGIDLLKKILTERIYVDGTWNPGSAADGHSGVVSGS